MVEMQSSTQLESHQQPQILEDFEIYRLDELERLDEVDRHSRTETVFQLQQYCLPLLHHKHQMDEQDEHMQADHIMDELESHEQIQNIYEM